MPDEIWDLQTKSAEIMATRDVKLQSKLMEILAPVLEVLPQDEESTLELNDAQKATLRDALERASRLMGDHTEQSTRSGQTGPAEPSPSTQPVQKPSAEGAKATVTPPTPEAAARAEQAKPSAQGTKAMSTPPEQEATADTSASATPPTAAPSTQAAQPRPAAEEAKPTTAATAASATTTPSATPTETLPPKPTAQDAKPTTVPSEAAATTAATPTPTPEAQPTVGAQTTQPTSGAEQAKATAATAAQPAATAEETKPTTASAEAATTAASIASAGPATTAGATAQPTPSAQTAPPTVAAEREATPATAAPSQAAATAATATPTAATEEAKSTASSPTSEPATQASQARPSAQEAKATGPTTTAATSATAPSTTATPAEQPKASAQDTKTVTPPTSEAAGQAAQTKPAGQEAKPTTTAADAPSSSPQAAQPNASPAQAKATTAAASASATVTFDVRQMTKKELNQLLAVVDHKAAEQFNQLYHDLNQRHVTDRRAADWSAASSGLAGFFNALDEQGKIQYQQAINALRQQETASQNPPSQVSQAAGAAAETGKQTPQAKPDAKAATSAAETAKSTAPGTPSTTAATPRATAATASSATTTQTKAGDPSAQTAQSTSTSQPAQPSAAAPDARQAALAEYAASRIEGMASSQAMAGNAVAAELLEAAAAKVRSEGVKSEAVKDLRPGPYAEVDVDRYAQRELTRAVEAESAHQQSTDDKARPLREARTDDQMTAYQRRANATGNKIEVLKDAREAEAKGNAAAAATLRDLADKLADAMAAGDRVMVGRILNEKTAQMRLVRETPEKKRAREAQEKAQEEVLARKAQEEVLARKAQEEALARQAQEKAQAEVLARKAQEEALARKAQEEALARKAAEAQKQAEARLTELRKEPEAKARAKEARDAQIGATYTERFDWLKTQSVRLGLDPKQASGRLEKVISTRIALENADEARKIPGSKTEALKAELDFQRASREFRDADYNYDQPNTTFTSAPSEEEKDLQRQINAAAPQYAAEGKTLETREAEDRARRIKYWEDYRDSNAAAAAQFTAEAEKYDTASKAASAVQAGADLSMSVVSQYGGTTGKAISAGYTFTKTAAGALAEGESVKTAMAQGAKETILDVTTGAIQDKLHLGFETPLQKVPAEQVITRVIDSGFKAAVTEGATALANARLSDAIKYPISKGVELIGSDKP